MANKFRIEHQKKKKELIINLIWINIWTKIENKYFITKVKWNIKKLIDQKKSKKDTSGDFTSFMKNSGF